jgi:hypothetical protein
VKFDKYKKIVVIVFFTILSIILFKQLFVSPILGVADNGDFQRLAWKIGLDYKEDPWTKKNYNNFFNFFTKDYKFIEKRETGFFSTHELIGNLSVWFSKNIVRKDKFSIKHIGFTNSILYLIPITMLGFFYLRRNSGRHYSFLLLD